LHTFDRQMTADIRQHNSLSQYVSVIDCPFYILNSFNTFFSGPGNIRGLSQSGTFKCLTSLLVHIGGRSLHALRTIHRLQFNIEQERQVK